MKTIKLGNGSSNKLSTKSHKSVSSRTAKKGCNCGRR